MTEQTPEPQRRLAKKLFFLSVAALILTFFAGFCFGAAWIYFEDITPIQIEKIQAMNAITTLGYLYENSIKDAMNTNEQILDRSIKHMELYYKAKISQDTHILSAAKLFIEKGMPNERKYIRDLR